MKKARKKRPAKSNPKNVVSPVQSADSVPSRRRFMNLLLNAAIAVPVVGGLGYYSVRLVQASISEADLTKIGNGKPAIVQIHDPQCSMCRTLQDQTRDVLDGFDADKFEYLVANIKTNKGRSLATRYAVPHVTLLLFSGAGKMVKVVRGPLHTANLRSYIASHLRRHD